MIRKSHLSGREMARWASSGALLLALGLPLLPPPEIITANQPLAISAPHPFPLSGLNGTSGFRLDGATANGKSGSAVSGVGDVNGDGYADFIVGADGAEPNGFSSGSSYVVFGGNSFSSSLALSGLNGTSGFRLDGASFGDYSAKAVSGGGHHYPRRLQQQSACG